MVLIHLYLGFFIAGAFAFGGGFAIIPFLNNMVNTYDWFTQSELTTIIALAELTPGAIGVNMATYAGFKAQGFIGAIIATLGLVTPSLIIVSLLANLWGKIKDYFSVRSIFNAIKASVCGLLFSIFLTMILPLLSSTLFSFANFKAIAIFSISLLLARIKKLPVFVVILVGGVLGILLGS